jgi:hypothetical protein
MPDKIRMARANTKDETSHIKKFQTPSYKLQPKYLKFLLGMMAMWWRGEAARLLFPHRALP